ncbi:unnamed protein product [Scytosiphon promiscuus]
MPVEDFFDLDPFPLDGMPLDGEDWLSTGLPEEGGNKSSVSPAVATSATTAGSNSVGATTRPGAYVPSPSAASATGVMSSTVSTGHQHQHQQQQLHTQLSVDGLGSLGVGTAGVGGMNPIDPIPEAMATAADVNNGNPALLPNVISHQLGPMPRLLDGLVSGCTAVVPAPSVNKRMKEECDDADDARPEKKMALDKGGSSPSVGVAPTGSGATAGSENGGGASSSPATAAPPASSNLVARPASADFRHGGGEELLALLKARVGRLFSLDAEYTHVRKGAVPENGAPAARGAGEGTGAANGGGGGGLKRVLSRLKAVRAGQQFVVHIKFDVSGKDECRPCDVSVLSWNESQEGQNASVAGAAVGGGSDVLVKVEGRQAGADAGSFLGVMEGSKPWRTSQHTAFVRVSAHAFQALNDLLKKRTDGDVGEVLVSFFIWMSKYDRLFQDPCKIANKLVATDSGTGEPLPPTLRSPDGAPLLAESLAGTPQREPQKPASPLAAASAAAAAGAATAEA